jgi:cytochrome c oxidase cbb3-type subunit 3
MMRAFVIASVGLVIAAGAAHFVSRTEMRAQLMRSDPDLIPRNSGLTDLALSIARPVYDAHCAACHGEDMRGDSVKGVPNLTDQDWLYGEGRVGEIERTILYGIRAGNTKTRNFADMPAFASSVPYKRYSIAPLEPAEIRDLVEFLLVSANKPGDKGAAARGGQIFDGKGQCFDCHQPDAKGDNAIGAPNLVDDVWLRGQGTRQDITDTISRGLSGFCPAWFQLLSPVTIRALAVFVYSASHGPALQHTR